MRNLLVAVLGTSPAVITEAFYWYASRRKPAILFSEVHIFTTTTGRDLLIQTLFRNAGSPGAFHRLLDDLGIGSESVTFDRNSIHILRDAAGEELADVRTCEDSTHVADQICARLSELAVRSDTTIYASIAGGRKTLGIYLALAMELLARPQDRLFHVLMDPRLGEPPARDFFYPQQPVTLNGITLQPDEIRIECDEIPLLTWPPNARPAPPIHFRELLEKQQWYMDALRQAPTLVIDAAQGDAWILGRRVGLEPKEFFYYWLAARLATGFSYGTDLTLRQLPARAFANWWAEVQETWVARLPTRQSRHVPEGHIEVAGIEFAQPWCLPLYHLMADLYRQVYVPGNSKLDSTRVAEFQQRLSTDFVLDHGDPSALLQSFSRIAGKIRKAVNGDKLLVDRYRVRKGQRRFDEPEEKSMYAIWLGSDQIVFKGMA